MSVYLWPVGRPFFDSGAFNAGNSFGAKAPLNDTGKARN